ncbi:MAG: class I SAM-dependent methyltransferase, partial [Acidobacteriota bacterium]
MKKARGRGPVVHLDRTQKAKMIDAFLRDYLGRPVEGFRMLDIGGGNGMISRFFADHNEVYAVDVRELRKELDPRVHFQLVDSETLPFDDDFFDLVLSHHVIEHVADQGRHLDEMRRVVKPDGTCYLGTPNKSSPVMEGHVGNDSVLRLHQMAPLFRNHGFIPHGYSV